MRVLPVVATVVVSAGALVGCSDGASERSSTTTTRASSPSTTTTTAPSTTTTTARPDLDAVRVALTKVADVDQGTALESRADDPALYVAEQAGRVVALLDGRSTPVLDISDKTQCCGEQGLLGIAFSPDGTKLYVHSTQPGGDSRVEEYAFTPTPDGGGTADRDSARLVLTAPGLQSNHNGGQLAFGPDGMLYVGLGDGGGAGDQGGGHAPGGNAQSLDTLLGKILRIDPTPSGASGYGIPPDNPFANGGGRPEIWAYGLRNPWRFSFDEPTSTVWIADVGQDAWEEIDALTVEEAKGANFGWNVLEGTHEYRGGGTPEGAVGPLLETSHDDGNCSITGGYVYRGTRVPALRGAYLFSDYCVGNIRAVFAEGGRVVQQRDLGISASSVVSFGVGSDGEMYVVSQDDGVFRIGPA